MKRKIHKILCLILCLASLVTSVAVLSSCGAEEYIDGTLSRQEFSTNCLNDDFAVFDDLYLKRRKNENNVAVVSASEDGMTLNGNFGRNEVYTDLGFIEFGDYILGVYSLTDSHEIRIYDTRANNFLTEFVANTSYSLSGGRLIEVKRIDNSIYFVMLVNNGYKALTTMQSGGEVFDLETKRVGVGDYFDSGYFVLRLDLNNGSIADSAAFLGGNNPKHFSVNSNGFYAVFKTKEKSGVYARFNIHDYSLLNTDKINLSQVVKIYLDGDNTVLFYYEYTFGDSTRLAIAIFNSELKRLDKKNFDRSYYLDQAYFEPNSYNVFCYSYTDNYNKQEYTKTEVSFDGKKLRMNETELYGYIKYTKYYSGYYGETFIVSTNAFDYDNRFFVQVNTLINRISFYDAKEQILKANIDFPSDSDSFVMSSFFYDTDNEKLYFVGHEVLDYDSINRNVYCIDINTNEVRTISCSVTGLGLNSSLGSVSFSGFRVINDRIYLLYNSLLREFDLEFNELNFVDLRQTVKIHFLNEDGSVAREPILREVGGKLTSEQIRQIVPFREGFRFVKWANTSGAKLYDLRQDVVLTAVWEVDDGDNDEL